MDYDEAKFDAFKDAVSRCRWFILATVIVSSLIFFHAFLERWSLSEAQLPEVIAARLQSSTKEKLKEREAALIKAREKKNIDPAELLAWAEDAYIIELTDHELANTRHPERSLPFLDMKIPYNDFLPIMAVMLAVFTVGVWLNVRSMGVAARSLLHKAELRELARLNFTFTGVLDQHAHDKWGRRVQVLVLFLPALVLVSAAIVDLWPLLRVGLGFLIGPQLIVNLRILVLGVMALVVLFAALGSNYHAEQMDQAFKATEPKTDPAGHDPTPAP